MKVKLLTIKAGPEGSFLPGDILEISPELGRDLIERGFAELIEAEKIIEQEVLNNEDNVKNEIDKKPRKRR